jgi:hypothetical protein
VHFLKTNICKFQNLITQDWICVNAFCNDNTTDNQVLGLLVFPLRPTSSTRTQCFIQWLSSALSNRPKQVRCFPPPTWGQKQIEFLKCALHSTRWWAKSKNPAITSVIHHNQNPLESYIYKFLSAAYSIRERWTSLTTPESIWRKYLWLVRFLMPRSGSGKEKWKFAHF